MAKANSTPCRLLAIAILGCALSVISACVNAYSYFHPNFQMADEHLVGAIDRIRAAQDNNGPVFGGHAMKAVSLIEQARNEIAQADRFR